MFTTQAQEKIVRAVRGGERRPSAGEQVASVNQAIREGRAVVARISSITPTVDSGINHYPGVLQSYTGGAGFADISPTQSVLVILSDIFTPLLNSRVFISAAVGTLSSTAVVVSTMPNVVRDELTRYKSADQTITSGANATVAVNSTAESAGEGASWIDSTDIDFTLPLYTWSDWARSAILSATVVWDVINAPLVLSKLRLMIRTVTGGLSIATSDVILPIGYTGEVAQSVCSKAFVLSSSYTDYRMVVYQDTGANQTILAGTTLGASPQSSSTYFHAVALSGRLT